MQILTISNRNFQKPSRKPSNRTKLKILKKKKFWIAHKKNLVPRMLSHRGNVRTSKFWRKSKEKKRIFFRKFTKGIEGFDLGEETKIPNYLMLVYLNEKGRHWCESNHLDFAYDANLKGSGYINCKNRFSSFRIKTSCLF
jgi:hypothetical protein